MEDPARARVAGRDRVGQRSRDQFGAQVVSEGVADDPAGGDVDHRGQIQPPLPGADIGDVAARDPGPGVIFHSDRGCQYTSAAFAGLASDCAVTLSHGRTGQCWDNALAESFFASIKGELLDLRAWPTRAMAGRAIVEYIGWYNGSRLHSTLGYRSPAEFEEDSKIKKVA